MKCPRAKGGFFSESAIRFFKKYSKKTILNLKFKSPAHINIMLWAGISNFKFRIVFLEYFFSRFGDLKKELYFLKKPPLVQPGGTDYAHQITTRPPNFYTFLRPCT